LSTHIDQQISTRPWWRRLNPTLVGLVLAIGAVAVIAGRAMDAPRKHASSAPEQPAAAPRHQVEPRAVVGALLPRHARRKRGHSTKKARPSEKSSAVQSARP
jgi:hypothetical protein